VSPRPATANPLRPKALVYLREERVFTEVVRRPGPARPAVLVIARILPAPGDRSGASVETGVRLSDGVWHCAAHPGAGSCSHRLAVQMVTGCGGLGGRWRA
jgi:hypothetical protein